MLSKSLLVLSVLALSSSVALGAPALSCPAASTVTVTSSASSSSVAATTSNVAIASSVATTSTAAAATTTSASSKGKDKGKGKGKGSSTTATIATTSVSVAATTNVNVESSTAAKSASTTTASGSASTATSAANNSSDAQSSLTLDPRVIATGFESDGQQVPTAGQIASATSSNNFINFCLTVANLPITNGQQIKTGSCNPAPMGVIASTSNMPSSKFTFPSNFGTVKANTAFTISMAIAHLDAGNFVNAQSSYYSAPQTVNAAGDIVGHTHVVIEKLSALDQTTPTDPTVFAFFKGVNTAAVNGAVTADVTDGLDPGFYRLASINAAANHQPVLVAVAQHGSLDDMVYFTVTADGQAAANSTASASASATASTTASVAASSSAVSSAPATTSSAATSNKNNGKGNNNSNNNSNNNNKGNNNNNSNNNKGNNDNNRNGFFNFGGH